jgi:hypothetical protein
MEGAQMGGTSYRYDRLTEAFTMVVPTGDGELILSALRQKIPALNAYVDALRTQEPVAFHGSVSGIPLKATREARTELKRQGLQAACEGRIEHPISFLTEFYNRKGIYYIQIEKHGFFFMGQNPFNFPVPEITGTFRVETRVGYAGGKTTAIGHVAHAGYRAQGRLLGTNTSPYSLDNQEHADLLFSKDWRPAAAPPSEQLDTLAE